MRIETLLACPFVFGGQPVRRSWLRLFGAGLVLAGAVVGYLASTGLGERLLHREIETQLTRLLEGPVEIGEVELRLKGGLHLEVRQLAAYPLPDPSQPPALRARRVIAWIDLLALLIGRLELSTLVLEAPHLRLQQDETGRFLGLPLPALEELLPETRGEGSGEAWVRRIESLDPAAETFFESLHVADRIEIQDGTLQWIAPHARDTDEPGRNLRLELVSSVLEREWLSDALRLRWSAVFVDGRSAPLPFEIAVGRSGGGQPFEWTVTMAEAAFESTPRFFSEIGAESIDHLSGRLTTQIQLAGGLRGPRLLTIDAEIQDPEIRLQRSGTEIQPERIRLRAEIEIEARQLRLRAGHLEGDRLGIDLVGTLERPIRPDARARVESRMVGVEIDDITRLARSLEGESETAASIARLIERVDGGRMLHVQASGTERLERWQDLLGGRVRELPDGFVLGAAFEELSVSTGPDDPIEALSGEIEWAEDRLTLRNTSASFRGTPLPDLHVVLEHASQLARVPAAAREMSMHPPPLPGLGAFLELVKPKDPDSHPPVKTIELAIDHLEHPVLRWPVRDVKALIEPLRRGMEIHIREGVWGGLAISGEVVFFSDPLGPTLSAHLVLGPEKPALRPASTASVAAPVAASAAAPAATSIGLLPEAEMPVEAAVAAAPVWGSGRFELEFRPGPRLPFQTASGFFRLEGTRLLGQEVELRVEPEGQIASRITLDLARAEQVGVDLGFALTEARLEHVSEFIALPPTLVRGGISATGSLRGLLRPGRPLMTDLDGRIRAEARHGEIRIEVPLLLRLSRASEGYNPFSNEDELHYEAMSATMDFRQGSLIAEDFEIEGPLRIYARGRLDLFAQPTQVRGVVGLFLFRAPNQILENLPLVRYFLPGSDRGLVGAYFKVKGALSEPDVDALPMASILTGVPSAIKAPFRVLKYLFDPESDDS